jgi:anti-sigma-K factor RskA
MLGSAEPLAADVAQVVRDAAASFAFFTAPTRHKLSRPRAARAESPPFAGAALARSFLLTYTSCMARVQSYWRWLGHRLHLSRAGRVLFTAAVVVGVAAMVVARVHGDREGGAPAVVLVLLLAGVVGVDAVGRGVVALVRRWS